MKLLFDKKEYHNYTKDSLFDSKNIWYWKWKKKKIISLFSKCSKCDTILVYDENKINNIVYYYCPKCNTHQLSVKADNFQHSQFILKREIKRKAFPKLYEKVS